MLSRSRSGADESVSWTSGSSIPSGSSSFSSHPPPSMIQAATYYGGTVTPASERRNNYIPVPPWHNRRPRHNSSASVSGVPVPARNWSSSEGILIVRPSPPPPPLPSYSNNMGGQQERTAAPSGMTMMNSLLTQRRFGFLDWPPNNSNGGREQNREENDDNSDSRLTKPEQEKALNKLTKEIYGPNPKTLIRNLGLYYRDKARPNTTDNEAAKSCTICLEDFEQGTEVMVTPCKHMFHQECIVPWVKSNGQCPVCRFVMCEPSGRVRSSSGWSEGDVARMNRRRRENARMMTMPDHQFGVYNHRGGDVFADHLIEIIRAMEEASIRQRTY